VNEFERVLALPERNPNDPLYKEQASALLRESREKAAKEGERER
jgi:hypothetical protein